MGDGEAFGPYVRARDALSEAEAGNNGSKLSELEARDVLRVTPGLFFKYRTTWVDVLKTLVRLGWVQEENGKYSVVVEDGIWRPDRRIGA